MLGLCESVADIGCDHAYLAIYLIEQAIAKRVYACDINEGPLKTAQRNINQSGYSDQIETILTNGLIGVEKKEPEQIVICGMGGELIAGILNETEYPKKKSPSLILQPMTKADALRRYLIKNSYKIIDEATVFDGRIYQIIKAKYNENTITDYNEAELLIGRQKEPDEYYIPLAKQKLSSLILARDNILKSGEKCPEKDRQIKELEEIINESDRALL